MAFRPSRKRKGKEYFFDLNLAPLLSLFVALIPMLLLTAIFQSVGIVNLYLPTAEENPSQTADTNPAVDFTLAVSLSPGVVSLMVDDQVLFSERHDGDLDLAGLDRELTNIKEKHPDKKDIVLLLDGSILYQTIIQVMDSVRERDGRELFPEISLADRVIEVQ
ncbi:MAG: biopolymer transporter ExbD [bacterium]|nr:MAG: biopolymer transporter ExbD [bacterium]